MLASLLRSIADGLTLGLAGHGAVVEVCHTPLDMLNKLSPGPGHWRVLVGCAGGQSTATGGGEETTTIEVLVVTPKGLAFNGNAAEPTPDDVAALDRIELVARLMRQIRFYSDQDLTAAHTQVDGRGMKLTGWQWLSPTDEVSPTRDAALRFTLWRALPGLATELRVLL
jgi:hypothetical protein